MPFIEQQLSADGVATFGRFIVAEAIHNAITAAYHVQSISISVTSPNGQGYAVGDTFRLNAGTPIVVNGDSFHATGRVVAISEAESPQLGIPTEIEIISWGAYSALPFPSPLNSPEDTILSLATTTLTGAGDDGLFVDIVVDTGKWTSDSYVEDSPLTDINWLVTSVKAANAPTIGMRSQLSGANNAIRMNIATSYSGILPWDGQPGQPSTNTFYFSVPTQDPKLYISTTERRVNVMVTDGTYKQYANIGLFIPFVDVDSNYPFPGIICGQSTSIQPMAEIYPTDNRGIVNPIDFSGLGCYQYRDNLSNEWFGITQNNGNGADVCRSQIWPKQGTANNYSLVHAPVPTGSLVSSIYMDPDNAQTSIDDYLAHADHLLFQADQSSAVGAVGPQPHGIGSQLHFTVQAHIISNQSGDVQMIGIIDGFENVHGRGLSAFDEIQNQDGRRYIVFQDTNSTDLTDWVAMEMI